VTATAGEGGTISPASRTVNHGSLATFTITPDNGYRISAVAWNCSGTVHHPAVCSYIWGPITADCSITAIFDQIIDSEEPSVTIALQCPASVKVGQPLNVTVSLSNDNCSDSVVVSRLMMGVYGSGDGTLAGFGIWGPYNKPLMTTRVVPAAVCTGDGVNITVVPGSVAPFNLTIMNAVPASLSGKMGLVYVEAITPEGASFGRGECLISAVPQ
jgi:hypothetical protein